MDDKELIKRIMEEVKDEKLREELLALVVEKNKKKDDTKQEEEKPIDYVASRKYFWEPLKE
jgi:SOS response regulatory protein OraA/RecX